MFVVCLCLCLFSMKIFFIVSPIWCLKSKDVVLRLKSQQPIRLNSCLHNREKIVRGRIQRASLYPKIVDWSKTFASHCIKNIFFWFLYNSIILYMIRWAKYVCLFFSFLSIFWSSEISTPKQSHVRFFYTSSVVIGEVMRKMEYPWKKINAGRRRPLSPVPKKSLWSFQVSLLNRVKQNSTSSTPQTSGCILGKISTEWSTVVSGLIRVFNFQRTLSSNFRAFLPVRSCTRISHLTRLI